VNLIQAQRLVRKICRDCKTEVQTPAEALIDVGFPASEVTEVRTFKGTGCGTCNGTGYKGRVGLYEVMEITEELRELILVGA
jgi:type IV pilus assembly protein PilB